MSPKFKSKFKQEFVQMLEQHLASGYSFQSFAGVAKVSSLTIYSWAKKYRAFKEVKEKYPYQKPKIYA